MAAPNPAVGKLDINSACPELRELHLKCQKTFYDERFLKGNIDNPCRDSWEDYRLCIQQYIQEWRRNFQASRETDKQSR